MQTKKMIAQQLVSLEDIKAARDIIKGRLHRTGMASSSQLNQQLGIQLYFKQEMFQKTGAFKVRGALNKLHHMSAAEKEKGVITISAGNHAQALAWGAAQYGVNATVVMPATAVHSKVDATKGYGGEVILTDQGLMDTCLAIQAERDLTLVHPFDDPYIIAGQGTMGLEIWEDVRNVDIAVIGIGGGGMISGVSAALKALSPDVRIIGVEPEHSCAMYQSLQAGTPVTLDVNKTVADGLAAPFAGSHNLAHVQAFVDQVVKVTDDEIVDAMLDIMEWIKVLPEPAAAAPYAAIVNRKFEFEPGANVVCLLSGGNVDRDRLFDMMKGVGDKN